MSAQARRPPALRAWRLKRGREHAARRVASERVPPWSRRPLDTRRLPRQHVSRRAAATRTAAATPPRRHTAHTSPLRSSPPAACCIAGRIRDPSHPAFGQCGLFAARKLSAGEHVLDYRARAAPRSARTRARAPQQRAPDGATAAAAGRGDAGGARELHERLHAAVRGGRGAAPDAGRRAGGQRGALHQRLQARACFPCARASALAHAHAMRRRRGAGGGCDAAHARRRDRTCVLEFVVRRVFFDAPRRRRAGAGTRGSGRT